MGLDMAQVSKEHHLLGLKAITFALNCGGLGLGSSLHQPTASYTAATCSAIVNIKRQGGEWLEEY